MGIGWRRARIALGLGNCISARADGDEIITGDESMSSMASVEAAGGAGVSDVSTSVDLSRSGTPSPAAAAAPAAPTSSRSSSRLSLIRTSIRLSRMSYHITCAICLETMKPGHGHALFTAECSHTFHFSCIASNVRHGNLVCPVCRAKWKEVPWQAPSDLALFNEFINRAPSANRIRRSQHRPNSSSRSPITNGEISPDEEEEQRSRPDPVIRILDESIANARGFRRVTPHEPSIFDDDEPLALQNGAAPAPDAAAAAGVGGDREPSASNVESPEREAAEGEEREEGEGEVGVREGGMEAAEGSGQQADIEPQADTEPQGMMVRQNDGEAEMADQSSYLAGEKVEDIMVTCHPEVSAVAASEERDTFTVLVHLQASAGNKRQLIGEDRGGKREEDPGRLLSTSYGDLTAAQVLDPSSRAPLDLVTVLDISGSMAGTKLILLKRAMAFVIRNLSPSDRLSVVAFSSSARRLFPLKRMVEEGRRHALRCVDSLVSTGGTNIADGLKKGAKMLEDRRMKNPVASIMLLSDGQDTYTIGNRGQFSGIAIPRNMHNTASSSDIRRLLPGSMRHRRYGDVQVPVHTFGFGADHDAATMHSISEVSGGTFSFIQAEGAVQDAFAQCIGGLLSVVSQTTNLSITTASPGVLIKSIQAGSYETSISENGSQGEVKLGDLYAEEERDILLELRLPSIPEQTSEEENPLNLSKLVSVSCSYCDPVSTEFHHTVPTELEISRPEVVEPESQAISLEVDRQRNRVLVAQSILEAGHLADGGEIHAAQQILMRVKEMLHNSLAFQAGDQLSIGLESELTEIQLRVANRHIYERTGRAYILSAQSSHFRQRATTRGNSGETNSREYQTSSMADMIIRSQTLPSGSMTPANNRRSHHSGRSAMSPSPTRMLLRRSSGRVQDSHGHHNST